MIFMSTQISRVLLSEIKIKKKKKRKTKKKLNEGLALGSKSRPQFASHFGGEKMVNVENIFSRYVQNAVLDTLTSHAWRNVGHERRELSCNN